MAGLYVHIPFCRKKCNYCDFVSAPGNEVFISEYIEAACLEMESYSGAPLFTIYIGGGTPSVLSKENILKLFAGINKSFDCSKINEITFEANPESLSTEKLAVLKEIGVNRLSFGVQSFNENELAYLGRVHSVKDFAASFEEARKLGFRNINLDLIYGLPGQTAERWKENLKKAVSFRSEHISLYPLAIEEGTPFFEKGIKIDEDIQADMYEFSMEYLNKSKFEHYEISNWSKKDFRCRHNLNYWHCGEYIGIGAAAASYLNGVRYKNTSDPEKYVLKAGYLKELIEEKEEIGPEKRLSDEIILNLRCSEGVRTSNEIMSRYGSVLSDLMKNSLIEKNNETYCLTNKGKLLANQVMMRFV